MLVFIIKGGGISCSYVSFVICEAIFRGRELIFFVGAHISIYFVNIIFFPPTSTLTTPQKGKNRKNMQKWGVNNDFWVRLKIGENIMN